MTPKLTALPSLDAALDPDAGWDALIVIAGRVPAGLPEPLELAVRGALEVDRSARTTARVLFAPGAPGRRLVWVPTGPLMRDHDDVRRVADAATEGARLARDAGAVRPVLALRGVPSGDRYAHAPGVALLAAAGALWEPLEARESLGDDEVEPVHEIGLVVPEGVDGAELVGLVDAVEAGRRAARDVAGTQPERMTPARLAEYVQDLFADTDVDVTVVDDADTLRADYPLLSAVARASLAVERHHPCVLRLVWEGRAPVQQTLLFAGKGVTYDTGGSDLKTDGHMAGMSRDKGGAAAIIGLFLTASRLAPPGLRLVAEIGAVRNSTGADAFVTDEILVSHAGVRVRVGNTDAEGRLVLADLLSHLREEAIGEDRPRIFSVATLTGHAGLAVGPYTIAIENGPARQTEIARTLRVQGEAWGDPLEISTLRREDYEMIQPRSRADDVLSANNKPSSQTSRGHQFPMAFLCVASGLDKHAGDGELPIPFTHLDIGGSGVADMDWQHGNPTAAPLVALAARYLFG
jgi:leucyl aminopeptidase